MIEQDQTPIEQKVRKAITALKECMAAGRPTMDSYSGGKDSTVCTDLIFKAALELKAESGSVPPIFVTHAETRVENPEIHRYAQGEIAKINSFAQRNGLDVSVKIARPYLNASWAVQIIGGRFLPVFANTRHRTCTIVFKVEPMKHLKKQIIKTSPYKKTDFVTVIGTRFDESASRAGRMEERNETDDIPWENDRDGSMALSPIAHWTTEDVWDYLNQLKDSRSSFSDLKDLFRLYRDGTSPEDLAKGIFNARYGCMVCTVGRDRSMENLVRNNPDQYGYLEPLLDLQSFLQKTNYDMTRRSWVGRSIDKHGFITITPDIYSPGMLAELLRYSMTMDYNEKTSARALGISPRFEIISQETLLAIDATWSLQGYHKPHTALLIADDVYQRHRLSPFPQVKSYPKPDHFPKKHLYVGKDWHKDWDHRVYGLRDHLTEAFGGGGCMGTKAIKNGRTILDNEQSVSFSFNPEALDLFFQFEYPDIVAKKREGYYEDLSCTSGIIDLIRLGVLQLAKGKEHLTDKIIVRTKIKEDLGLTGPGANVERLLSQSISHAAHNRYVKAIEAGHHPTLPRPFVSYSSVSCRLSDIRALIKARLPVSISCDQLVIDGPVYKELINYAVHKNGHVLIDSGALSSIYHDREPDFDKVLDAYHRITQDSTGAITLIGPEKPLDQAGTFLLLEKHAFRIRNLINIGAQILIPIQKGKFSPGSVHQIVCDILSTTDFGLSLPARNEPFTDEDLKNLLSSGRNFKAIHFQGITDIEPNIVPVRALVDKNLPDVNVSLDRNPLSSALTCQSLFGQSCDRGITLAKSPTNTGDPFSRLSLDQLTHLFETFMPVDSKHNPLTLALLCQKSGPDHEKIVKELGPDWHLSHEISTMAAHLLQTQLNTEIKSIVSKSPIHSENPHPIETEFASLAC